MNPLAESQTPNTNPTLGPAAGPAPNPTVNPTSIPGLASSPNPSPTPNTTSSPAHNAASSTTPHAAPSQPAGLPRNITLADVEAARQAYQTKRSRIWHRSLIIVGLVLLIVAILSFTFIHDEPLAIIVDIFFYFLIIIIIGLTASALVVAFTADKESTAYHQAYKAHFVEKSLAATFTNLRYNHAAGFDRKLLEATGMIKTGDIYHSNDLTIAQYKNVPFVQADAHIEEEYTDSDGDTHYVTIFKGRFMLFQFPKQFSYKLELIGKPFKAAKVPKQTTGGRKMIQIKTESSEFNRTFKIYAEDGVEAYYLLDPAYMTRIQAIADAHKHNLFLGFMNNALLIGINDGKDSFEPPNPKQPINEAAEIAKVTADIKVITHLVDLLLVKGY